MRLDPELLRKESLAVHQLAHQGLPRWHVGVRLDPHPSDGLPPLRSHLFPDLFEHIGISVLHPLVLHGLAAHEVVVGVALEQAQLVREGPGAFALGLTQRPQPRAVDVRMPHRDDGVGGGSGPVEERSQHVPGRDH